jgi:hypothetical protein
VRHDGPFDDESLVLAIEEAIGKPETNQRISSEKAEVRRTQE